MKSDIPKIHKDLENFIGFLKNFKIIELKKTIILGRSLGCLFASKLSTKFNFACLVLISPFYSIRKMISEKIGNFLGRVMEEKDETFAFIKENLNLTLIIHGKKDKVCSVQHAEKLKCECKSKCHLVLNEDMEHCITHFRKEVLEHVKYFVYQHKLF